MTVEEITKWLPIASVVLAAIPGLWAAFQFILIKNSERKSERYKQFYEVANVIGGSKDASIVAKVAAIYELRKFPEYRDVIIRICEGVGVSGDDISAKSLREELKLTAEYFKSLK